MKRLALAAAVAAAGFLVLSCPNPLANKDLRAQVADEVALATASEHHLTVAADPNGVVTPVGVQTVKDNVPVALSATAFPAYGVIGWKQTAGPGTVKFEQTASGVTATVTGGSASVAAILVEKPKVLYSTPIGNNIARSATVTATFSRQVDFDTISLSTFKVLRNGSEQVTTGQFTVSADGKTVKFDPVDPLGQFCNYVINVAPNVKGVLNLGDYQVGNALITDSSLLLATEYTAAFRTNADEDNNPPDPGDFIVTGTGGSVADPYYTGSARVMLSGITANDDSGTIAAFYVKNAADASYQSFTYDYQDPTIAWSVPFSPGPQSIMMYFEDPNGNKNSGSPTTKSIVVDTTGPTGTVTVSGVGPGADYMKAGAASLVLSAADPDIGALKGSGESANGSALLNRKLMRFGNSLAALISASWEPYSTPRGGWSLSDTAEGWKTVFAQFADAVGNVSAPQSDQVYLDPTAPTGSFQMVNGLYTNAETITLLITASDGGSGLDKVQITASAGLQPNSAWSTSTPENGLLTGAGATAADFSWPADARVNVVLATGEGSRVVNLLVKDKVGNAGALTRTLTLDKTPPPSGAISINGGAALTNSTTVTLTLTVPSDSGSGVPYMGFSNTTTPPVIWISSASTASWVIAGTATNTVRVWFKDGAGNVSASPASDTIDLDTVPPSGTITASPSPTTGLVTIYCNTTDLLGTMRFSNNNSSWSPWEPFATSKPSWSLTSTTYGGSNTNGTRTIYAQYKDTANNISTTATFNLILDNTAPTATISINSAAAWTTSGIVTLTLTAADAIYSLGSLQMQFSNDNVTWSTFETFAASKSWNMTSGYGGNATNTSAKYVYYRVRDPLGNTSGSYYDYIGYDTVVPVAGTISINSAATYTTSASVTLTLASWTDATSGVYQMHFSNNASSWSAWEAYATTRSAWDVTSATYGGNTGNGSKYVYVQVKDNAGLIYSYTYDGIIYDNIAPSGTFTIESGNPATSTWTDGYLLFSITDATSGMYQRRLSNDNATWSAWETYTSSRAAWYLTPRNGLKTVYAQFKDNAGNISSTIYDQVTLAETYSSLGGQDLWGAYSTTVSSLAATSYMSTGLISGSDPFASSQLAAGSVLVFYTNSGRYGKMEITGFIPLRIVTSFPLVIQQNILTFNLYVYNSDGISLYRSVAGAEVVGTYTYDLDGSGGADFYWQISTDTTRYLTPQGGARFSKWK
jgi:hypothetical protein